MAAGDAVADVVAPKGFASDEATGRRFRGLGRADGRGGMLFADEAVEVCVSEWERGSCRR